MKIALGLVDRILFACGLLLALQIPQFLDHYTQRYAGYRDALAAAVTDYQRIADVHHDGNLDALVAELRAGSGGVRDMGDKLQADRLQLQRMDAALRILREGSLWARLRHLVLDADVALARGTLADFKPGLPLTMDALICGAIGALLASGLFNLLILLLTLPLRQRREAAQA